MMAWSNLYTIQVYLHKESRLICFFKNMETSELDHMIRTVFNIEEDVDIIGFEDEQQRIIPLSYLSIDPRRLNQQERNRIMTNPIQSVRSIPEPRCYQKFYRLILHNFNVHVINFRNIFIFLLNFIYSSYPTWIRQFYLYGPGIWLSGIGFNLVVGMVFVNILFVQN